jgi:undecaprenyl-diphosphatase
MSTHHRDDASGSRLAPVAPNHTRALPDHQADGDASRAPTLLGAAWPVGWRTLGVLTGWCAVVVGVFWGLGEVVERSPVDDADRELARDVVDRRTDTLDAWAPWGAGLSDTLVKIVATTIIVALMFWAWRRWVEPLIVAGALIFEASAFMLATLLVGRPRPDVERLQDSPVNSSWPSGHVAAATAYAAIAVVVCRHLRSSAARVAVWAAVVTITVVVAAARIYQGMHFASDVVAGVALGALSVAIVTVVIDRAAARRSIDPVPSGRTTPDQTSVMPERMAATTSSGT